MIRQLALAILILGMFCTAAVAQSPPAILHYQANLLDGQQEVDREIDFTARIFASETAGQALWSEPRTGIPVSEGRLSVLLGSQVDLPPALFDGDPRYLEIEIDGEVLPRLRIASTAYALRAGVAAAVVAGAVDADALAPDAAVTSINAVPGDLRLEGANGATVNVDPTTKTITISAAGGTTDSGIVGIQNSDGTLQVLDPNGPTTTINIQSGSIGPSKLAAGAVTAQKLATDAVTRDAMRAGVVVDNLNGLTGALNLASGDQSIDISTRTGTIDLLLNPDAAVTSLTAGTGLSAVSETGPVTLSLADGGVGAAQIAAGAITQEKLAPDAITSSTIVDSTITAADLGPDAAVRSINSIMGDLRFEADGGATLDVDETTRTITFFAPEADGGTGILELQNSDGSLRITDPTGPTATIDVEPGGIGVTDLADGGVTADKLAARAVTGGRIADDAIQGGTNVSVTRDGNDDIVVSAPNLVQSIAADGTTLTGDVTLAAGDNTTLEVDNNTITFDAPVRGLTSDETLTGDGTNGDPLGVADEAITSTHIAEGAIVAEDLDASDEDNGYVLTYSETSASNLIWQDPATITSSRRFKEEIETISDASTLVRALRGVRFQWTSDGRPDVGLIAEEVAEVLPELVTYESDGTTVRGVRYAPLVSVLVEAFKTQQQDLEAAHETLTGQKSEIEDLRDRLSQLEALVQSNRSRP